MPCPHCGQLFVPPTAEGSSSRRSSPWPWLSDSPAGPAPATTVPSPGRQPARDATVLPTWKPGDVILGLYEVREVFTSGGRGLVYRVRHRGWDMDLAVKCPRPECFRSEQDKEDFEQEAETWVKLGPHPHLVACYYVRRLGDVPRVFAEYVAGGSLDEWIRTRRLYAGGPARSLARVLDVALQFAWGLQHAHTQGLVHRDVKPGNVLMTAEGVAKVTDFGMAKARGLSAGNIEASAGSILISAGGLTPAFCSPEQVQGKPVSRKTDIWSWGVSLLAMFLGEARWSAGYMAAGVLEDYLERGPAADYLPRMPPGMVELLRHCFRSPPDDRPRDMLEITAVLQRLYAQTMGRPYPREAPQAAKALADSLNNRALSLVDLHKVEEAEHLWEEALAAGPHHPEATYNLGLSRWRAGRLSAAALVQKLQDVCTSHPGEWLPLYLLGRVHLEQGNWGPAVETLARAAGAGRDDVHTALETAREGLANTGKLVRCFSGHSGWVSSVARSGVRGTTGGTYPSRDGRFALSGSADGTLKLWTVPEGRCLRTFGGHTEWVTSVSLSADGRFALSGSADRTLRLWDTTTGDCLRTFAGHANWVLAVALSADGCFALSAGGEGEVRIWETATGVGLRTLGGHAAPVLAVCWSADGHRIVTGSRDRTVKLWDRDTGECLRTFEGHADKVLAVGIGRDGRHILSGGADRTVKLWEAATGKCLRTFEGHQGAVTSVGLGDAGCQVLSSSEDRTVKLWQATSGRCLCTLEGHKGTVNAACFLGDGTRVLSASADQTLALWSVPGELPATYMLSRVLPSAAALAVWTDYERVLARAAESAAAGAFVQTAHHLRDARAMPGCGRRPEVMDLWASLYVRLPRRTFQDAWGGDAFGRHGAAVTAVALSPDARFALSGSADRTLKLWETRTGRCLHTFADDLGSVAALCLAARGRYAVSAGTDGAVQLWDLAGGTCLRTCRTDAAVLTSVAASADARFALAGSTDGSVRLWDLATGRLLRVLHGHTDAVHSVALRADGRLALSGSAQFLVRNESERLFTSGQLKCWDLATGRCRAAFEGPTDAVTAVALSADGRHALTGSGQSVIQRDSGRFLQSGPVHFWDLASGCCLRTLAGHSGAVTSVCLSLDGRYALSGGTDATVKLWDLTDGHCLRTFCGHADAVTSVALSDDGRYVLSGSADHTLALWLLDWELEDRPPADWDEDARPFLERFLTLHTPYRLPPEGERKRNVAEILNMPLSRLFKGTPAEEDAGRVLARQGQPVWTSKDFQELLAVLGCAGYGWLRPEGVRRRLDQLAHAWNGPGG
jgi:WD40 repeat protein/serine/threonine protein kinase